MPEKDKKLSPFDFINNINQGIRGEDLLDGCLASPEIDSPDDKSKEYNAFMVNRGLSQFEDTLFAANEMNINYNLPTKMKYDFLRNVIRPKKRFSKWAKKEKPPEDIKIIKEAYCYSEEKALQVYDLVDMEYLRNKVNKGGRG